MLTRIHRRRLALDALQRNTLLALRQRERLADIGEAVAKINHDMQNVLFGDTCRRHAGCIWRPACAPRRMSFTHWNSRWCCAC